MNILILGSGGREHALAWKLSQSPLCGKVYIAPGNGGTGYIGENLAVSVTDFEGIAHICREKDIELLVVGPEDPLVAGLADKLADARLPKLRIFGPPMKGAQLEGSKDFAKQFMLKHGIPTARYQSFNASQIKEAQAFLNTFKPPYVLKADGLAAGKGVVIPETLEIAKQDVAEMLGGKFGAASSTLVIEEFLSGIEVSVFVITDGESYKLLPEAKDYKRIGEGDKGLNTGGMGAISPVPFADAEFMTKVEEQVIKPTIKGLKSDGIPYTGFIFFGLMSVSGNPYVIEYNVRMGDPETEAVLPRIDGDLLPVLLAACEGRLKDTELKISSQKAATIVCVSAGYPEAYEKGKKVQITSLPESLVFHSGTRLQNGQLETNGGRVFAVTSLSDDIHRSLEAAYRQAELIDYEGKYFRRDIGQDLLKAKA